MNRGSFLLLALSCAGCFELDYVGQAAEGQLDLLCRARSIESSLENPDIAPERRKLLAEVPAIKKFGQEAGSLTPTSSYETYVDLDRSDVVFVVTAAPPLSLEPKRWWFPIVGSISYLGWFDEHLAKNYANELAEDGWDVDVRGAAAYSTLGWFSDPVLSTMIEDGDDALGELANTILHESVHATIYVPGQPDFNEGIASFVGDRLTLDYLAKHFGAGSPQLENYVEGEERGAKIRDELVEAHTALKALYESDLPDEEKLAKKKAFLTDLRKHLRFRRPITNATLANYNAYHGAEGDFAKLFEACGSDVRRVVAACKTAGAADFELADAPEGETPSSRSQRAISQAIDLLAKRCAPADAQPADAQPASTTDAR
ncbi:MAG: aminopeptidase [Polyangiaceae bacterium]